MCGPVKFFHCKLGGEKNIFYRIDFVHGSIVVLKQERRFPKLAQI